VLVDRGHRELPIQADVVGKRFIVGPEESVEVRFEDTDEVEKVMLMEPVEE
jgi:pyrimidine operon attenuation protein/uracil phosphoribosyltransferase